MDLIDFLSSDYVVIIPALWILGFALKQTPKVPDWSIIWILTFFALTISILFFGFSLESITNGIIAAGTAVYGHQMIKQTAKNGKQTKNTKNKNLAFNL